MTDAEIASNISHFLTPRPSKKRTFGEVFTPIQIINDMLDILPKTVWKNPNLRWFDPTAGVGNFMSVIFARLRAVGHKPAHIIANMLFMCELDARNAKELHNLFGARANITKGDFLTQSFNMQFDIIVGNPPFSSTEKHKLYEQIIDHALNFVHAKSHVVMLTPDNIFSSPAATLRGVKTIVFSPELEQAFNGQIQQPLCWFHIVIGWRGLTTVINANNPSFTVDIFRHPINPVRHWTKSTEKLTNDWLQTRQNAAVYNRGKPLSEYSARSGTYKCVYTPSKNIYTNRVALAIGHGVKKIIIFIISPLLEFVVDNTGNLCCGPNTIYIPFTNVAEGKKLATFFASETYKTLALATRTTRQFLKLAFIQHLNLAKIVQSADHPTLNKTRRNRGK